MPNNGSLQSADVQFNDQDCHFQPFQQEKFGFQGKRLLGEILNNSLEPDSPDYNEKLALLLRDVTVERRKGDLDHHVKQLSQTSETEQPFHLLRYAAYLSSNNLLHALRTDKLLCWILDSGNFWVIEALLALSTPTTSTFASALLNSAVRLGESNVARQLLQNDVDPNFSTGHDKDYWISTLDEAVRARNTALVRLLVQKGAEVRIESWEASLLHKFDSCSDEYYLGNVQFVIDYGEDVNKEFWHGMHRTLLDNVIAVGDLAAAQRVLQAGARVNYIPRCCATPLQAAAGYGNAEMVKLLIRAGANIDAPMGLSHIDALEEISIDSRVCGLLTPLQIALAEGRIAVAEILLQYGADVNGFDASAYCDAWAAKLAEQKNFFPYYDEDFLQYDPPRLLQSDPWDVYYRGRELGLLDSPLQAAARKGDLALARRLLSLGANIHAKGGFGTALQVAASRKGNSELVKFLLDQGADINAPAHDPVGRTALQAAIQYSDMETIHFLLESGADVNADVCLANGRTALQAAVQRNDVILAKLLILLKANVNAKASSFNGRTCLQAASEIGNMQMIDLLLKHGAEASAPPSEFSGGKTALQAAVAGKHITAVKKLLKHGGDPNVTCPGPPHREEYKYPLWDSMRTHQHEMTKLLLENGANPNNITGSENPLALAIRMQELQTVQLLIFHGADINALNYPKSESMLQVAAAGGSLPLCRFLIAAGAELKGSMGTAALSSAVRYCQTAVIQFLLSRGVSPNWEFGPRPKNCFRLCSPISTTFEKLRHWERSPADDIIKEEIAEILLCSGAEFDSDDEFSKDVCHVPLPLLRRLIEAGLNINRAPHLWYEESPLQYASREGMIDVVKLLLGVGADVNMLPSELNGRTALQGAVKGQHIRVAELLLSKGADVNGPPSECHGATALQEAVIVGSLPLVVLLLKKGANVNAAPSAEKGQTALEAAAKHGRLDIVHLLLKEDKELDTLQTRCRKAAELALLSGFPILANVLQDWKREQ